MTQEHKDMLMKDLSARLPYHVKVEIDLQSNIYPPMTCEVCNIEFTEMGGSFVGVWVLPDSYCEYREFLCKPYLFPMSSMTEEQENEYVATFVTIVYEDGSRDTTMTCESFDWLNKHMFDYRGLIQLGLAKDATGLGIYS